MWKRFKKKLSFKNHGDLTPQNINTKAYDYILHALHRKNPTEALNETLALLTSVKVNFKVRDLGALLVATALDENKNFDLVDRILPYIKHDARFKQNFTQLLFYEYHWKGFEKGTIAQGLIERGADVKLKCIMVDENLENFIFLALREDDKTMINYLLNNQSIEMTPELWGACRSSEMIEKLVNAGCNTENMISYKAHGNLIYAIEQNNFAMVKDLIKHGNNFTQYNASTASDNINPLLKVTTVKMFHYLREHGAQVDDKLWKDLENEPDCHNFLGIKSNDDTENADNWTKKEFFYFIKLKEEYKKDVKILEKNQLPIRLIQNTSLTYNNPNFVTLKIQAAKIAGLNVNKLRECKSNLANLGINLPYEQLLDIVEKEIIKQIINDKSEKQSKQKSHTPSTELNNLSQEQSAGASTSATPESNIITSQAIHGAIPKIRKKQTVSLLNNPSSSLHDLQKIQLDNQSSILKKQEQEKITVIEKKYQTMEQNIIQEKIQAEKIIASKTKNDKTVVQAKLKANQEKREKLKQEQKQAEQARISKEQAEKAKQERERKEQEEREQRAKARKEQEERERKENNNFATFNM